VIAQQRRERGRDPHIQPSLAQVARRREHRLRLPDDRGQGRGGPLQVELPAPGELLEGGQHLDEIAGPRDPGGDPDPYRLGDRQQRQLLCEIQQGSQEVAEVVDHPGGEPTDGAQPLHVQELLLGRSQGEERVAQLLVAVGQTLHEPLDGPHLEDVLARLAQRGEQLLGPPGLGQEAEHPRLVDHRDQGGAVGVRGDHQAGDVGLVLADRGEQLHPGHPGHPLVRDDQVDGLREREAQGLLPRRRRQAGVVCPVEHRGEHIEVGGLVVDDQDPSGKQPPQAVLLDELSQPFLAHRWLH